MGYWPFNRALCDAYTSLDVLLCTASILNLCAISIDRYFVITRPFQYAIKRTMKHMIAMIAAVWVLSALISIPPLFGWRQYLPPVSIHFSVHNSLHDIDAYARFFHGNWSNLE